MNFNVNNVVCPVLLGHVLLLCQIAPWDYRVSDHIVSPLHRLNPLVHFNKLQILCCFTVFSQIWKKLIVPLLPVTVSEFQLKLYEYHPTDPIKHS